MPQFKDHIKQAQHNLKFLEDINAGSYDCIDWQVTVCFYTALHLVNAHLSHFNLQYRRHESVKNALNPEKQVSLTKLPEDEYIAYMTLQNLSRRSRYLVNEKNVGLNQASITHEKHLGKALRHLDKLICYFDNRYSLSLTKVKLRCSAIKSTNEFSHLVIIK